MPTTDNGAGVRSNATRAALIAALSEAFAQFDLSEVASIDGEGNTVPNAEMRLHKNEDAPNFNPSSHASAPQYITFALMDSGDKLPVRYDGEMWKGNRIQLTLNVFRAVPESYVAPVTTEAPARVTETPKRIALTAEQIKAARGALSGKSGVESHPAKRQ